MKSSQLYMDMLSWCVHVMQTCLEEMPAYLDACPRLFSKGIQIAINDEIGPEAKS